jgi:hypothetical protein
LVVRQTTERREFPNERFEVVERERRRWTVVAVGGGLVLALAALRIWLAMEVVTPWILIDELIYADLARSVAENGTFQVRGEPIPWFNFGYAALIAPAWAVTDGQAGAFTVAKTVNVILGLVALVPVFVWARRLMRAPYAVLAVVLTALMPGLLYAGTLMSENGFLPTFLLAALVIARALERPTLTWQIAAFLAIGLAAVIRVQGAILLAVLATAIVLGALLEARASEGSDRLRAGWRYAVGFWPSIAALLGLAVAFVGLQVARGRSLSSGLGSYEVVAESDYALDDSLRWIARHFADVVLATGFFPVSALIILVGLAVLRPGFGPAERAFLATSVAALAWIVPQAALFATNFAFRIEERYMFCAFPLLFIALALWLDRGAPRRPWPLAGVAAVVPAAALLFALPLRELLRIEMLSDSFALVPLLRLTQLLAGGMDTVVVLVAVAAVAAAFAFLAVPRRFVLVLPLAIAALLVLSSYSVHGAIRDFAQEVERTMHGPDRTWVDRASGGQPVDYVYGGGSDLWFEAQKLWQAELWNTSLDDVYNIGVPQPAGIVEVQASIDAASGRIALLPQDVQPAPLTIADERLGISGRVLTRHAQLALYRLQLPAQLRQKTEGIFGDGWTGAEAALTQYVPAGNPRQLSVTLSRQAWGGPDVPGTVTLRLGTVVNEGRGVALGRVTATRTWVAHSGRARAFVLRTPPPPFRVEISVSPTFSPSQFGSPDTRQLGVQVAFALR